MFPNCLESGLVLNFFKRVQIKAMKRANGKTGLANTDSNSCIEKLRKYFLVYTVFLHPSACYIVMKR